MTIKKRVKNEVANVADEIAVESKKEVVKKVSVRFDKVLSTGSTLLDLAISGGRISGGGVPAGILVEVFGASGSGKTALLASICADAQRKKGVVKFCDPESRLDREYSEIYGLSLVDAGFDYSRPNTVLEMFQSLWKWKPESSGINVFAADSVASLSTNLEMDNEEGDKMGMRQAKEFSQNLRKSARLLGEGNTISIFNNQVRRSDVGETTSGGKALEFYCSLRLRVSQKSPVEKVIKLESGKEVKKILGIESEVYVKKSTIDAPYRSAPIYILFNYGIDDIRGNLQWYKDMTKETKYDVFDGKTYVAMEKAIQHIEENDLQGKLRGRVISMWEEIEHKFVVERKPKMFW